MGDVRIQAEKAVCSDSELQDVLVSVIVPVYKVEKYLKRCVDSIICQTYKKLQIILVDDGSPDRCGFICDEYALRDERISVIHQENKGLAAARNTGLKAVSGEWIAWVDSDDWVEPDYIYAMLSEAVTNQADIVICGRCVDYPKKSVCAGVKKQLTLDGRQAVHMLLENDEIGTFLWDKLWRADLFRIIRFPEGRNYEDLAICYKLLLNTHCVVCIPEVYYHYTIRKGSIIHDEKLQNLLDRSKAISDRYAELIGLYPEYSKELEMDLVRLALRVKGNYCRYRMYKSKEYYTCLYNLMQHFKSHPVNDEQLKKEGLAGRIVMKLLPYDTWWSNVTAGIVGWLYRLKNGESL